MTFVFGDLSGSDEDAVIAAGCYLGREDQWAAAVNNWAVALKDAGVTYFHATDFYSAHGEFDSDEWRYEHPTKGMIPGGPKQVAFAARFTAIANDAGLIGFSWACELEPFRSILAPEMEREERVHKASDPYLYAAMSALTRVSDFLTDAKHAALQHIQIGYELEDRSGRFVDFFKESQKRMESWTKWFHSFTAPPKSFEPVQIADLLAHEAWRRAKEVLSDKPRDIRKSFKRMLMGGKVELQFMQRADIERNAAVVRDLLARYPKGLVPNIV
jgi:hypothetical protein